VEEKWQELRRYLDEHYHWSVFDEAGGSDDSYTLHLHGRRVVSGRIRQVSRYDLVLADDDGGEEQFRKLDVKFLYPSRWREAAGRLVKKDAGVAARGLEPIVEAGARYHVKNKTLFPFMQNRTVLLFTTLEGDVLRGLVGGIHRYELTLFLKGGVPVTLLRHAIFDVRDKKGVSWLKEAVRRRRKKS